MATSNPPRFIRRLLSSAVASIACTASINPTVFAEAELLEEVVVIGNAASLNRSLIEQRMADNIKSVISADAIGKLPDTNVSEALQRVPGVSIERDQGEGRFVSVRGLSPDLNAVSINGMQTPSPEADRRAVALDVIPADLVETLIVSKSLTPDMDADAIGGSVEVKSISGFSRDDAFYSFNVEGSRDQHSGENSPKLAGSASNIFSVAGGEDNLAIAGAVSWFKRDFGSDNVETGGKWDIEENQAKLEEFEQRSYTLSRERLGAAVNVDFKVSPEHKLYLRSLYSEYTDNEQRLANILEFEDELQAGELGSLKEDDFEDADGNEFEDVPVAVRELKQREETQKILSLSLGGEFENDDWKLEYSAGYSQSQESEPLHIGEAKFTGIVPGEVGFSNSREPRLIAPEALFNAENFLLESVELGTANTEDTAKSFRLDISRKFEIANYPTTVKFGGKLTRRDKRSNETVWEVEDLFQPLSQFSQGQVDYELGRFGPSIQSSSVLSAIQGLERELDIEESNANDFRIQEDLDAVYAMATVDIDQLRLLVGGRYQEIKFSASGFAYDDDADDGQQLSLRTAQREDKDFLPALHLRYQWGDNTQLRAAWTQSIVRPSFEQARPGYVLEDDGEKGSFGNPNLKPWDSKNIDLGIEHYMGFAGVVSAFVFYKDIDTFIYDTISDQLAGFESLEEAEIALNGNNAEIFGLELAWSKQLSSLPEPWNGLLLSANATFVESEAQISTSEGLRDIRLPKQSDSTANFTVGYDTEKLTLRLAANYKSDYLDEIDAESAANDVVVDDHFQLDFSARYFINDNIQLFFEAINLNDEPFYAYVSRSSLNAQYEEYGPTFKLGATITHF